MMLDRIFIWCDIRDFDLDFELEVFNIGFFLLMLQLRQNYTIMLFNKLGHSGFYIWVASQGD